MRAWARVPCMGATVRRMAWVRVCRHSSVAESSLVQVLVATNGGFITIDVDLGLDAEVMVAITSSHLANHSNYNANF